MDNRSLMTADFSFRNLGKSQSTNAVINGLQLHLSGNLPILMEKFPKGRIYAFSRASRRKSGLLSEQQKSAIKQIGSVLPLLHCGKLTLTKGERVLRIEVVVHNTGATSMWALAGEVSPNPDAGQEHSGALYGCLELYRSVLHRR
jgi:hypothetical protein